MLLGDTTSEGVVTNLTVNLTRLCATSTLVAATSPSYSNTNILCFYNKPGQTCTILYSRLYFHLEARLSYHPQI
jgi:hypothetical protein